MHNTKDAKGTSDRLEALRAKEQRLREEIAKEKVNQQRKSAKTHARICNAVGAALLAWSTREPERFAETLKEISKHMSESDRALVAQKGWS